MKTISKDLINKENKINNFHNKLSKTQYKNNEEINKLKN